MSGDKTKISLVLGSGGARGLAHIGVIQWLEENDYSIESIAGCSMGALVGGIYALGKMDEFIKWVKAIDNMEILKLLDFNISQGGLVKGDKIINTLSAMTGDSMIEDLNIAYTAVAVDINNEKEVWISHGPIFEAIRASISLPLLFTPYEINGTKLLDGGILNPVPIAPTFKDRTDQTIAVNLLGPVDLTLHEPSKESRQDHSEKNLFAKKISRFIDSLTPTSEKPSSSNGFYEVSYQAIDAMQGTIARQKLAAYPPSIVLEVPRNLCGLLQFDKAEQLIEYGYQLAEKQLG